jgi:GT2 family glycosyltransferase
MEGQRTKTGSREGVRGATPAPAVSVVVVNWNTCELTLKCLDSLPAAAGETTFETIVVENGSVDGSAAALRSRREVELIPNSVNVGFAAAVNEAYRRSHGEFVLLLNSDVEMEPGGLTVLVDFLRSHVDAAGVGPLYVNPDGSPQPFHFRLPTFTTLMLNGSALLRRVVPRSDRILRRYRMLDDDFSKPLPVAQPSASCLLLRRSALLSDRIFDERYPIFFNDVQFARWLRSRSETLWVTPDTVVVHEAHSSGRRLGASEGRRIYVGSLIRMLQETEPAPKVWLYRLVVLVQNVLLALVRRPEALTGRDLLRALGGDPGPMPTRPSR